MVPVLTKRQVVPNLTEDATSTGPIHPEEAMLGFTASLTLCSACPAVWERAHQNSANALTLRMEENGNNAIRKPMVAVTSKDGNVTQPTNASNILSSVTINVMGV